MSTAPDLTSAAAALDLARAVVGDGVRTLAASGGPDAQQVLAYDLAHAAAAVETARSMLDYGAKGDLEGRLTCAFVADALHDLVGTRRRPGGALGPRRRRAAPAPMAFVATYRDPEFLAGLAGDDGPRHLDPDFEMVQDTFRRFAEERIAPVAEHIHRTNGDIPEDIIAGLAEMGAFGLSACPRSTAAGPAAASPTTSAWSSPPRSCPAGRSASAARSSPGPRSSPGRS